MKTGSGVKVGSGVGVGVGIGVGIVDGVGIAVGAGILPEVSEEAVSMTDLEVPGSVNSPVAAR